MNPRLFRALMRVYPPYVGAGIRLTALAPDYSSCRVEMPLRWYNRNYVGTHFGGSLASMTDPFYMLLLLNRLGPGYVVWDLESRIRFVKPGPVTIRAEDGSVVAEVDKTLYVRRKQDRAS